MIKREGRAKAFVGGLFVYCLATFPFRNRGSLKVWIEAYKLQDDVTTNSNIHQQDLLSPTDDDAENYHNHSVSIPKQSFNKTSPSFSACLILKEDNHWLSEWLPYHYQTARLRHLLVIVDPSSRTSPKHIFDRWKVRYNWWIQLL